MKNDLVYKHIFAFLMAFILLYAFFSLLRFYSVGFYSVGISIILFATSLLMFKIKKSKFNARILTPFLYISFIAFVLFLFCILTVFINFDNVYVDRFIELL
ncbi:MAG: hypothetical protein LBT02_04070 [Rickettsiales bacterium]|nr:hypothetical protein [Rickettsiales bacterium]